MEMSYVDLLEQLKADIESDIIPSEEKSKILILISQLESKLWKYSY